VGLEEQAKLVAAELGNETGEEKDLLEVP